jgi:hypothetical protein
VKYARSGDVAIAYQLVGEGPPDLVLVSAWFSHVEARWDIPAFAHYLRRLSSFSRLISFDKRGIGLSDPVSLDRHRGRVVRIEGDGTLSTFDGPARAVRCAAAIRDAFSPLGVEIRAGLHTGEVELAETGVEGIAIHIGARVAALAGPGEVLVSRTVKDLVAGSGLEFRDCGTHELKGVPDTWQIFQAES